MQKAMESYLHQIFSDLRQGNYAGVLSASESGVLQFPNAYQFHHFQGVAAWQLKSFDQAIKCFKRSLELNPAAIASYNCMGLTYLSLELPENAVECFKNALKHEPNSLELHINQGKAFALMNEHETAVASFQKAILINDKSVSAYVEMAISLRNIKDYPKGLAALKAALTLDPSNPLVYNALGNIFNDINAVEQAIGAYRNALLLQPQNAVFISNLAGALRKNGELTPSLVCFQKSIAIDPNRIESLVGMAVTLNLIGQFDRSAQVLKQALKHDPTNAEIWHVYGNTLLKDGKPTKALEAYSRTIQLNENHFGARLNIASIYRTLGQYEQAMTLYNELLAIQPESAVLHFNLGVMHREMGAKSKAIEALQQTIGIERNFAEAYRLLSLMGVNVLQVDDKKHLETMANNSTESDASQMHANFALGRLYNLQNQPTKSFAAYQRANSLKRKHMEYKIDNEIKFMRLVKRHYGLPTNIDFTKGCPDETPIFILGMPRSGTTLTEVILASHSMVSAGGERQCLEHVSRLIDYPAEVETLSVEMRTQCGEAYVKALRGNHLEAIRITDKLPGNFMRIGFLFQILPNAKVIYCKRDAMDNCCSIYEQHFSGIQPFAYDLNELAKFYALHVELMAHWQKMFGDKIFTVEYEALVSNPESTIRQLLDHCTLPFEESCLNHHERPHTIKTASAMQANLPIYTSSIGKHRFYGELLDGFKMQLTSLVENWNE